MIFSYKGVKASGEAVIGEREAIDRGTLSRELKATDGLTLVEANEKKVVPKFNLLVWANSLFSKVKMKDQIMFASSLSAMLDAGLSLARSLNIIERQSSNKRFKLIINDISGRVSRGSTLSAALQAYAAVFPSVFIAMVAAGEESGKLSESLEIVRQQLQKNYELRRKVKGAMIYPAVIVSVIIVIGILMMIFLVPQLTSLFKELKVELPLSTRVMVFL